MKRVSPLLAVLAAACVSACGSERLAGGAEAAKSTFASLSEGKASEPASVEPKAARVAKPSLVKVDVDFDATEASRINMPGYSSVVGQAKLVLNIGTMHGRGEVRLVPFTEYARARYRVLFKGLRCFSDPDAMVATDPRYAGYVRKARIDDGGRFSFDQVYPGAYWVEVTFENFNALDKDYKPALCTSIGRVDVHDGGAAVVDFSAGPGI